MDEQRNTPAEQAEERPHPEEKPARRPKRSLPARILLWVIGIFGVLIVTVFVASFFLDEPLRRQTESRMNRHLKGYTVRLPGLHFQLLNLSMTLKGLTVYQQAYPNPPLATFPLLKASVHWREIFSGKLVGEFRLDRPTLHINLQQLRAEAANKVPVKQRGWQQAVEDIYPLKINALTINDATITYIDQDPKRPLNLSHLNLSATNIRNIHLPDKVYPSSFHLETMIFGKGRGVVDGRANFLAEPFPGVKASFKFEKVPLDYFKPLAQRANLLIEHGSLETAGDMEFAPNYKKAHVEHLIMDGVKIEYRHMASTAAAEAKRAAKAKKTAKKLSNKPDVLLRVDKLKLTNCTFGMVNRNAPTPYRVFLADTNMDVTNFSNNFEQGPADVRLSGKFMGSGVTNASAKFRPEKKGPDLDLYVKIMGTQLTSMNDLLRAYGKFDVARGTFSLVTELHVKNNYVTGYIKPFFKDIKVYDRRKDKDRSLFKKMYELLVGGVAKLLENRPRQQVATKAEISGPLRSPKTSALQIVVQLIRNAFIKAILPTFEREVTSQQKR